jgi:hypothetical protein
MNNNPLRQYFRRPAVYLTLPSRGKDYPPGSIDMSETGELPVYPMTAIDEITTRTPDALFNGTAVVDLIKSCIPSIKDPWSVSSNDLDAILIAIKAASSNGNLEVDSFCPNCSEMSTYQLNLTAILSSISPGDYSKMLDLGDIKIKFRPLMYREINQASIAQFELQKVFATVESTESQEEKNKITQEALASITSLTMMLVSNTIEYVQTPNGIVTESEFILDYLRNCDRNTYTTIRDYNTSLKEGSEIKPLDITCSSCEHQYKQDFTLNPTDFFD